MIRRLRSVTAYVLLIGLSTFHYGCKSDSDLPATTFEKIEARRSGVDFANQLKEDEDFNIIEYLYFYNGGGVAIGDINNDGLADLYFSANQGPNKLYLNKGDFVFEDITAKAGVSGAGNWKTGVVMVDVNADGLLDIYSCGVGRYKKFDGSNELYVNNGDLTFTERSKEYGLAFQGLSTHAAFLDYDSDGDLDMYLLNHSVHTVRSYGDASARYQFDPIAGDRFYENHLVPEGKTYFTDATTNVGIYSSPIGYGLGVAVSDVNLDGAPDIYVSNDFHENDYLYINQGDKTFKQKIETSLGHSSRFSMGSDFADINNDGLPDLLTLDMLPRNEQVIKTTAGEDPFDVFQYKLRFGYYYQFAANCLQLNRGQDEQGNVLFSDIAALAGVEATDWSWAPLIADFDNDGMKDIFIANGIVRRPNDLDYINFISNDSVQRYMSDRQIYEHMPSGKVANYAFRGAGKLSFEDVSVKWFGTAPTLSNGAAYGDLDNDGDLDLVVNNINERAGIYRNNGANGNSVQVKLKGPAANPFGVGTKVTAFAGGVERVHESYPSRGWQSSVDYKITIGLGNRSADSIVIVWPDQTRQVVRPGNEKTITVDHRDGKENVSRKEINSPWRLTSTELIEWSHEENEYNPFAEEKLIPHMLSTQGPALATGDLNADGRIDFFIGGAKGQPGVTSLQQTDGTFRMKVQNSLEADSLFEDTDAVIADINGDKLNDLIVASGGQEETTHASALRIYVNSGRGILTKQEQELTLQGISWSCVKAADIDNDGDVDLFVGGQVIAGKYGVVPNSVLLLNDGKGNFADVSDSKMDHSNFGMVSDALFTDINRDGRIDLVLVGLWMPVTIMIQDSSGKYIDRTKSYGLHDSHGWWYTIASADFDKDGDDDLVVGNYGVNTRLRPQVDAPVEMFIGDIDRNNGLDHILTYYNNGTRYPFLSKDQLIRQVPPLKRKFLRYDQYKNVQLEDIIPADRAGEFVSLKAQSFESVYLENVNGERLDRKKLPVEIQMFPVFAMLPLDVNGDGHLDLLAGGNLYGVQPELGRQDSGIGVTLLGDGRGSFEFAAHRLSGFLVRGQCRGIADMKTTAGSAIVVARNNNTPMIFRSGTASHRGTVSR